jgi:hypothetical protein
MTKIMDQLRDKIARLVDPMAFTEPTANNSVLYRLDSFEEGREKAASKAENIVEALPWRILDMIALIDGYEWSSDDLKDLVFADAMDAFKEKAHENWLADQRRIREAAEKKLEGEEKIAREIEKLARILCTQDGHDPDGGLKRGYGWINYKSNAVEILKSLGMIDG